MMTTNEWDALVDLEYRLSKAEREMRQRSHQTLTIMRATHRAHERLATFDDKVTAAPVLAPVERRWRTQHTATLRLQAARSEAQRRINAELDEMLAENGK